MPAQMDWQFIRRTDPSLSDDYTRNRGYAPAYPPLADVVVDEPMLDPPSIDEPLLDPPSTINNDDAQP